LTICVDERMKLLHTRANNDFVDFLAVLCSIHWRIQGSLG